MLSRRRRKVERWTIDMLGREIRNICSVCARVRMDRKWIDLGSYRSAGGNGSG